MANRTFCDYCSAEIISTNESSIGLNIEGEPKDLCSACASRVKEALDAIPKDG